MSTEDASEVVDVADSTVVDVAGASEVDVADASVVDPLADPSVVDMVDASVVDALVDGNRSESKSELEESVLVEESVLLADVGGNSGGKSVNASLEEIEVADSEKLAVVDPLRLKLRSIVLSSAVLADEAPKGGEVVARDKLSKVDDSVDSLDDVDTAEPLGGIGATDVALTAFTSAGWLLNPQYML